MITLNRERVRQGCLLFTVARQTPSLMSVPEQASSRALVPLHEQAGGNNKEDPWCAPEQWGATKITKGGCPHAVLSCLPCLLNKILCQGRCGRSVQNFSLPTY